MVVLFTIIFLNLIIFFRDFLFRLGELIIVDNTGRIVSIFSNGQDNLTFLYSFYKVLTDFSNHICWLVFLILRALCIEHLGEQHNSRNYNVQHQVYKLTNLSKVEHIPTQKFCVCKN